MNVKFESNVLVEAISAILKENQRDQEVVLSVNLQLLLHQTQATRPGDILQSKSIQNSCRIYCLQHSKHDSLVNVVSIKSWVKLMILFL